MARVLGDHHPGADVVTAIPLAVQWNGQIVQVRLMDDDFLAWGFLHYLARRAVSIALVNAG